MAKSVVSLFVGVNAAIGVFCSGNVSEIGRPMPEFSYSVLETNELTLVKVKKNSHRALLVEFWATWCAPCRDASVQLSKLHAKFSNQGLHIVSITAEQEATVRAFLKKHAVPYQVALDDDGNASRAFGTKGLPFALLVDTQSVVRWMGDPRTLTEAAIEQFIESGVAPASIPLSDDSAAIPDEEPLLVIRITRPADQKRNSTGVSRGDTGTAKSLKCKSKSLPQILRAALNVSESRIIVDSGVSADLFSVEFEQRTDAGGRPSFEVLVNALMEQTGHSIIYESRKREVWVASGSRPDLAASKQDTPAIGFNEAGEYAAIGVTLSQLFNAIEARYKVLIQNETQLSSRYDFSWKFDVSFEELRRILATKYGIKFVSDERLVTLPFLKRKP